MSEIPFIAKATAILALGLVAAAFAQRASAAIRHALISATFVVLLILPVAVVSLPEIAIRVPIAAFESVVSRPPTSALSVAREPSPPTQAIAATQRVELSARIIIRIIWVTGAALVLVSLAAGLWRVRRLRRTGLPTESIAKLAWRNDQLSKTLSGVRRPIEVLLHEDVVAPLTCGVLRPVIIMPRESTGWGAAALRRALIHELEHVRRFDWWVYLAARTTCAIYWFHPLVWIAYRQLTLDAERACDDAVIAHEESTQYAEQLVALARQMVTRTQPALSMASRSDLAARVSAVLDPNRPRGRAGVGRAALVVLAASALLIAIAPIQLVASVASGEQRRGGGSRLDRALVEAADEGDVEGVKELLDGGANINATVDGDGSPLIAAARGGYLELVTMLLDRGADPNLAASGDGNPLIMAAGEGHTRIVELLLDRGARVDDVVPGDENALITASGQGKLDAVKLLVSRGADVNARVFVEANDERPGEWRTPLSMARREGHRAVVEYLISVGATR